MCEKKWTATDLEKRRRHRGRVRGRMGKRAETEVLWLTLIIVTESRTVKSAAAGMLEMSFVPATFLRQESIL